MINVKNHHTEPTILVDVAYFHVVVKGQIWGVNIIEPDGEIEAFCEGSKKSDES